LKQRPTRAVGAVRAAEDRLRAERRHLVRRRAEQRRAFDDDAATERQEQLAIRVDTSEKVVCKQEGIVEEAGRALEEAEGVRDEWRAYVNDLESEAAEAERHAANPGTAPNAPGLVPGVSRVSDMDDEDIRASVRCCPATAGQCRSASGLSRPVPGPDNDREARLLLGPGHVLDDDAEEWAVVMVTYGGQARIASSFLPPADVERLLRLGLEEAARM
jgi:hypothetical protein